MASMVIRNIPDDVMERFKARAKEAGKSAEQLAREAIAEKGVVSREDLIRRMDEIRAMSKRASGIAINDEIRHDRDNNLGKDYPDLDDDH